MAEIPDPVPNGGSLGPYMNVWCDMMANHEGEIGRLRVGLYGAYNAMGLIGPEHNGMYVLDNKLMCVVVDRAPITLCAKDGIFMPTANLGTTGTLGEEGIRLFQKRVFDAYCFKDLTNAKPRPGWPG